VIYGAPKRYFAEAGIKTPSANANPGDTVTISETHVFADVAKGWLEFETTLDTAEFMAESVGERDSRTTNPKIPFQVPGITAAKLEAGYEVLSDDWIFLVPLLDGTILQVGTELLPCDVSLALNSGKVSGGYKGGTYEAETFGKVYIYTGDITKQPVA
jgi:hypothetical protein